MASNKILVYPSRAPVSGTRLDGETGPTGRIDYLRIQRCRINFDSPDSGYGGSNLPGNKTSVNLNKQMVYMAMPQSVVTSYSADYAQVNMGQLGVFAAQLAGNAMKGGPNMADKIAADLEAGASSAFPEIAFNKGASIAQNLGSMAGLETGVTGGALQQLTKGRIMNPFTEQIFNGVQFRNHQFNIKMFARNRSEAEEIMNIIKYMKTGLLPILGNADDNDNDSTTGGSSTDGQNGSTSQGSSFVANKVGRFLQIPDRYLLEFVRLDPESDTISKLPHYRFQPCVCTSVNVNYTPDGQYVSFKDAIANLGLDNDTGAKQLLVPAVEISMSFAETRILTQSDAQAGY